MTTTHSRHTFDAASAAVARSVLSCPAAAAIVVDGVEDVLAGGDELGMQDLDGVPTFSCEPDSPLAVAGAQGRSALVTLESGLGARGGPERDVVLSLAGRLEVVGSDDCVCCEGTRMVVVLRVDLVMLTHSAGDRAAEQIRVPRGAFESAEHQLNRGYLQRSAEHANTCHQDELRRAVSALAGLRLAEVVGVALSTLEPHSVEVRWVGVDGAHSRTLVFPRTATTPDELGELLRDQLHAGLC